MNKLIVSSSPHIRRKKDTPSIMLDVVIALLPAVIASVVLYGFKALIILATCVLTAVVSEFLFNLITKRAQTIFDFSAVITGLILGLGLSTKVQIWQCVLASVFAIIVVKCFFGGLGANFANPAATARIFLLICFSNVVAGGVAPDLTAGATPLEIIKGGLEQELPSLLDMFLGKRGGAIGEGCILALVIGFIYLVARGVIKFETPLIMIATVFVLSLIESGDAKIALYQTLGGGVIFAAIFMITDYSTTPITRSGKMIFAFGCGLITFLIRTFGQYPEGVSFSVLIMNIISPYIEKWTRKKPFGGKD